ncbi:MAG: hypothetical protein P8Z40_05690 [Chloroflexota bacterium]
MLYKRFTIPFDSGKRALAIQVPLAFEPEGLAGLLNLTAYRGAVAVVGGAEKFDTPEYARQRQAAFQILREVAALAARENLVFIDGGTPYGAVRLLARACSELGSDSPPLVGVAPLGLVRWPGCSPGSCGETDLDATHSAFILVEADRWGAESDMLAAVAYSLSSGRPAVELLINGGDVARRDADAFLRRGGNLVVLEGSGRFADQLAGAVRAGYSDDPGIQVQLTSGRLHVKSVDTPPLEFVAWLEKLAGW